MSAAEMCGCGDGDCQTCFPKKRVRKTFSGSKGPVLGFYTSLQMTQNAMRAERINKMLDEGLRVFGDDGQNAPGKWHELDEALTPQDYGIDCRTKDGKTVRIYGYDGSEKRQKEPVGQ